jgi:hypothetical protein
MGLKKTEHKTFCVNHTESNCKTAISTRVQTLELKMLSRNRGIRDIRGIRGIRDIQEVLQVSRICILNPLLQGASLCQWTHKHTIKAFRDEHGSYVGSKKRKPWLI